MQELEARGLIADLRRNVARGFRRASRSCDEEGFDDPVFQRVKTDHRQATADLQRPFGGDQAAFQFAKFLIDGNSQGLKNAGGRMDPGPPAPAQRAFHHLGEIEGAREGRLGSAANESAGDAPRLTLFAIQTEDTRQLGGLGFIDQIGGGQARAGHAHVQRSIAHQREPALGLVHLHGRYPQVQGHAVRAPFAQCLGHGRERSGQQAETPPRRQALGEGGHGRIAVKGDDACSGIQKGAAVTARAESAVDQKLPPIRPQRFDHLGEQNRRVRSWGHGRSAAR